MGAWKRKDSGNQKKETQPRWLERIILKTVREGQVSENLARTKDKISPKIRHHKSVYRISTRSSSAEVLTRVLDSIMEKKKERVLEGFEELSNDEKGIYKMWVMENTQRNRLFISSRKSMAQAVFQQRYGNYKESMDCFHIHWEKRKKTSITLQKAWLRVTTRKSVNLHLFAFIFVFFKSSRQKTLEYQPSTVVYQHLLL